MDFYVFTQFYTSLYKLMCIETPYITVNTCLQKEVEIFVFIHYNKIVFEKSE